MDASKTAERISRRLEPVIRRGMVTGADVLRLYALDGESESEVWCADIHHGADPELLAAEAAGVVVDEESHAAHGHYRLRCYQGDEGRSEVSVRTAPRRGAGDPVGAALLGGGESESRALVRQAMRHAESAVRTSLASIERREAVMLDSQQRAHAMVQSVSDAYVKLLAEHREALAADRAHEVELLKASAWNDAIGEGTKAMRELTPAVRAHLSGESIIAPLVGIVARLGPEHIAALVASGVIDESEGKRLEVAARKAKEAIGAGSRPRLVKGGKS